MAASLGDLSAWACSGGRDELGVPAMVANVDGVAGDELRGGDGFGGEVILGLRWFPIKIE